MGEQDQLDKSGAKPPPTAIDEPAELVKGLVKQGAYEIAKTFIDFLADRDKESKPKGKTSENEQTQN